MQDLRTYWIKAGFSRSSQKKGERNNFSYAAQAFSTSFYEPSTARLKQTKQNKKADGKKMPSLKLANSSPAPGLEKRSRSEPRALGTHQQFSATTKGRRARRADLGLHFHQGFSRSQWKPCYQASVGWILSGGFAMRSKSEPSWLKGRGWEGRSEFYQLLRYGFHTYNSNPSQ